MTTITTLDSSRPAGVYPRLNMVCITQVAPFTFHANIKWTPHTKTESGEKVACGSEQEMAFTIDPANMGKQIALRDSTTGAPLNAQMTYGQLVAGVYSAWIEEAGFSGLGN